MFVCSIFIRHLTINFGASFGTAGGPLSRGACSLRTAGDPTYGTLGTHLRSLPVVPKTPHSKILRF